MRSFDLGQADGAGVGEEAEIDEDFREVHPNHHPEMILFPIVTIICTELDKQQLRGQLSNFSWSALISAFYFDCFPSDYIPKCMRITLLQCYMVFLHVLKAPEKPET